MLVSELFAYGLAPEYLCLSSFDLAECLPDLDERELFDMGRACRARLIESVHDMNLSRGEKAFILSSCLLLDPDRMEDCTDHAYGKHQEEVSFSSAEDFFHAVYSIWNELGLKCLERVMDYLALDICALKNKELV